MEGLGAGREEAGKVSRRPAAVTQAEVERLLKAAKAAGLTVHRIVANRDSVSIVTAPELAADPEPVDDEEVVVF